MGVGTRILGDFMKQCNYCKLLFNGSGEICDSCQDHLDLGGDFKYNYSTLSYFPYFPTERERKEREKTKKQLMGYF